MKRLFLLDAYALIFRAYYALIKVPRLTRSGFNTSAIFGFVNTLEEVLRKENPTHIAVCFDPQGPTFRNQAYQDYKAERAATPEDIKLSVPIIKDIVRAYNIPVVEVEGFEADDVIGTLARMAEKSGFTSYMMTPDKDFGQLVSPSILQYKPSYRGQDFELRGEEEVCQRYGIKSTSQVIDLLALMGDKIDNIPGCPGVGEKTAIKLINEFGSVDNLLLHTDTLKGALRKKIEENTEQITFSKYLATIRTDVPVDITPDDLARRPENRAKLFSIFEELEFKSLTQRVEKRINQNSTYTSKPSAPSPESKSSSKSSSAAPSLFDDYDFDNTSVSPAAREAVSDNVWLTSSDMRDAEYSFANGSEDLDRLKNELLQTDSCGLFIFTEGENDMACRWIGSAIATRQGRAFYIPRDTPDPDADAVILDLMGRPDLEKVTLNAKRDYVVARRHRNDSAPALLNFYDCSIAHYVIEPEGRHSSEQLSSEFLNFSPLPFPGGPSQSGKKSKSKTSAAAAPEEVMRWACQQADIALRLKQPLSSRVDNDKLIHLLKDVEFPLVPVLAEMEFTGVRIDTGTLLAARTDLENRLVCIEKDIYSMAGTEFNVGSPAKVGEILFERLALDPKAKKTKTGQYSTSEDVLEKLASIHPIAGKIMEYRALKKLINTYLAALPEAINPVTGRVHTNYNQTITATGRLSSSSPNLQNIPVRDEEGREIRKAFIAEPGCLFLSADYSQIELRLLADFSHDEIMLDAFRHGKDIHAITAAKIYHKDIEDVTPGERRHAKTANFGIVYGISAFGLASRLSIPRAEAKEIIDNYFLTFPTVRRYMSESVEKAREQGYVETRMGRRRMLPDINSRNPVVRGYAERNAVNAPIQGTAADIIKLAMVRIYEEMNRRGLKSRMIMQVHDELNFNVPEEEIGVMQELVSRQMEDAWHGDVTLTASSGVASNWLEAH